MSVTAEQKLAAKAALEILTSAASGMSVAAIVNELDDPRLVLTYLAHMAGGVIQGMDSELDLAGQDPLAQMGINIELISWDWQESA